MRPLGGAAFVPYPRVGSEAPDPAAADHPYDVELMRALPERHAPAHARVHLLRQPRAVHPIVVVPRVDHPQPPELAARHDLPYPPYRQLEAVRVPHHQLHAVALRRADHRVGVLQRQRHRLLHNQVLPLLHGRHGVLRVQVRRRGDVDGVHVGALAELLKAAKRLCPVIGLKPTQRLRVQVRGRRDGHPRILHQGRNHPAPRLTKAGDGKPQCPLLRCGCFCQRRPLSRAPYLPMRPPPSHPPPNATLAPEPRAFNTNPPHAPTLPTPTSRRARCSSHRGC